MSFMRRVTKVHVVGLKSRGLFLASPSLGDDDDCPSEAYFFDPSNHRHDEATTRAELHAKGDPSRRPDDAGFVVDGREVLALQNRIQRTGERMIAPFHSHRRQPASFSILDYRLHNPLFGWHLVVSMRDPKHPRLQPFAIRKPLEDEGTDLDDDDAAYEGPEVQPIQLLVEGSPAQLEAVERVLADNPYLLPTHDEAERAESSYAAA